MGWTNKINRGTACKACGTAHTKGAAWLVTDKGVFCSSVCANKDLTGEEITQQDPEATPWRDRTWRLIRRTHTEASPLFLQMNDDGTATQWKATMYGPLGTTGTVTAQTQERLEEVKSATDKRWLEIFIGQLEQSNKLATTVAKAMTNGKDKKQ